MLVQRFEPLKVDMEAYSGICKSADPGAILIDDW